MRHKLKLLSFVALLTFGKPTFTLAQVEAKPPAILPGQTVGNQVVITTAGSVVGSNDSLPRVPTDNLNNAQVPQGVVVDARRDYLDAVPNGQQFSPPPAGKNPPKPADPSSIKLPSLPIEPSVD